MSAELDSDPSPAESAARRSGRAEGLATAALGLSVVSFVNLLGAEKALLAIVLAALAFRSAGSTPARFRSLIAIGLSVAYVLTIVFVLVVFHDKFEHLIHLLRQIG